MQPADKMVVAHKIQQDPVNCLLESSKVQAGPKISIFIFGDGGKARHSDLDHRKGQQIDGFSPRLALNHQL